MSGFDTLIEVEFELLELALELERELDGTAGAGVNTDDLLVDGLGVAEGFAAALLVAALGAEVELELTSLSRPLTFT